MEILKAKNSSFKLNFKFPISLLILFTFFLLSSQKLQEKFSYQESQLSIQLQRKLKNDQQVSLPDTASIHVQQQLKQQQQQQQYISDTEYNFTQDGKAIIAGLRATTYAANVSNCFQRGVYFWFHELELIKTRYRYGSLEDNVYNTTLLMKNTSNALWICTDTVENYFINLQYHLSQFIDLTDWLTAFFQNLLANIITFNNLYKSIDSNSQKGNETGVWYDTARLVRIIVDFDPIDWESGILEEEQVIEDDKKLELQYEQERQGKSKDLKINSKLQQTENEQMMQEGIKDLFTINGGISFIMGMFNGTKIVMSKNLSQCQNNIEKKWTQNAEKIVNRTLEGELVNALYAFYDMTYNSDLIVHSCVTGAKESVNAFITLLQIYKKPKDLIENIVHEFGHIWDALSDVLDFMKNKNRGQIDVPYKAGYAFGTVLWLILNPNTIGKH